MRRQSPQRIAKQVLLGTMLGDGCLVESSKTKAYLKLAHGEAQLKYLLWKMRVLFPLVGSFAGALHKDDVDATIKGRTRVHAWTLSNRYLHHVYDDFYLRHEDMKKKIVRMTVLNRMSPMALAIWHMDDGHISKSSNVHLYTNGFDEKSHANIVGYFANHLLMKPKIDHDQRSNTNSIRLGKNDSLKFLDVIRPHVPACMAYKIDPSLRTEHPVKSDEEIVRTLQECRELVRKHQPIAHQCLTDSDKDNIRDFIIEHWPNTHHVNHWRQGAGLNWFTIHSKNPNMLNRIKDIFGGNAREVGRTTRYQTTLANGIRMMLRLGLVT